MTTLATDIVHMYRVVNHILIHCHTKTIRELSQELFVPDNVIIGVFCELKICIDDSSIKKKRAEEILGKLEQEKGEAKKEPPGEIKVPQFVMQKKYIDYHAPNRPLVRPPAVYNNTPSPYGIADDLHHYPEKYGEVIKMVKNKFGKLNKRYLTSAL